MIDLDQSKHVESFGVYLSYSWIDLEDYPSLEQFVQELQSNSIQQYFIDHLWGPLGLLVQAKIIRGGSPNIGGFFRDFYEIFWASSGKVLLSSLTVFSTSFHQGS